MIQWRIYYGNGTTFSNEDGPAEQAPPDDVQAIAQQDETVGREVLHGGGRFSADYYWWDRGRWWVGDIFGLFGYLRQPGARKVVFGQSIEWPRYSAIMQRAMTDPDLESKSARLPKELPAL